MGFSSAFDDVIRETGECGVEETWPKEERW